MPSDHFIPDHQALADLVLAAKSSAETGSIITFGIQPDRPETGTAILNEARRCLKAVVIVLLLFESQMSRVKAMLASGKYFGNTGLFLTHCGTDCLAET